MYIEECKGCKYFICQDDVFPNAVKFGSREMGYCSYYPKNSRKCYRSVQNIKNCENIQRIVNPKLKWVDVRSCNGSSEL